MQELEDFRRKCKAEAEKEQKKVHTHHCCYWIQVLQFCCYRRNAGYF